MAITEHPPADFQEVFRDVTTFLGVRDMNYPEGDEVMATSPYTKLALRKKLLQADVEVALVICSVQDHPFRNKFFTEDGELAEISAGAMIPSYMGVHGGVSVKVGNAWRDGDVAQSFDHLKRARLTDLYGSHPELYWIENGKLELTDGDLKGKVRVPTIPVQDAAESDLILHTPYAYTNGVLANCLAKLRPVGADQAHRGVWMGIWGDYLQMIYGKALNLPQPERMQRRAE